MTAGEGLPHEDGTETVARFERPDGGVQFAAVPGREDWLVCLRDGAGISGGTKTGHRQEIGESEWAMTSALNGFVVRATRSHRLRPGPAGWARAQSAEAAIDAEGRFVAFTSGAKNAVAGDTNGEEDFFVRDRRTGEKTGVSLL